MKLVTLSLLSSLALAAAPSWADCAFPKAPSNIPDATSASESEMISTMSAFKQYNTEVDSYLTCLDSETEAKAKDPSNATSLLQFKALQQKKRSSATEEREAKVALFNEQVRIFKARKS